MVGDVILEVKCKVIMKKIRANGGKDKGASKAIEIAFPILKQELGELIGNVKLENCRIEDGQGDWGSWCGYGTYPTRTLKVTVESWVDPPEGKR